MRKITYLLLLGFSVLSAQSISRVEFAVLPGNLIEVNYTIYDDEPNAVYRIDLYASLDGGYSYPIKAESVTGDVGPGVVGAGRKSILWKVLDDMPALVSDNLVVRVTGQTQTTFTGVFRSIFAGNRVTKRLSNGITFYGGGGEFLLLERSAFSDMIDDGRLLPKVNSRFGLRITSVPFVYRFNVLYSNWGFELNDDSDLRLKYLSYGDRSYNGEDIILHYAGFSFSFAYTPIPVFGVFLPQVGCGVSANQLRIGNRQGSTTSSLNNPGLFAEVGVQINLMRWLKLNVGARQNFLSNWVNFTEGFLEVGLNISTE